MGFDYKSRPLTREMFEQAIAKWKADMERWPQPQSQPRIVSPSEYRASLPLHRRVLYDLKLWKQRLWFRIKYGSMDQWLTDPNNQSLFGLVEERSSGSSRLFSSERSSDSDGKSAAASGQCCRRCGRELTELDRLDGYLCWVCTDSVM
jgi:hypothetical protein